MTAELGKFFKFQCVVGMNGRVWVDSTSVRATIAVVNAFQCSEYMSDQQVTDMVKKVVEM